MKKEKPEPAMQIPAFCLNGEIACVHVPGPAFGNWAGPTGALHLIIRISHQQKEKDGDSISHLHLFGPSGEIRYSKEWPPSSRRPARLHRSLAFDYSNLSSAERKRWR